MAPSWWLASVNSLAQLAVGLVAFGFGLNLCTSGMAHAGEATFGCEPKQSLGAWLSCDAQGHLKSVADVSSGARIGDYSQAGYAGGARPLPWVNVVAVLTPSGKDDTKAIQEALAKAGELTPDERGIRGRVLLAPGTYKVSNTLALDKSGVVLEGTAASGPRATTIKYVGKPTLLFAIGGSKLARTTGSKVSIPGTYASGTSVLTGLKHSFKAGQSVRVSIPYDLDWIKTMWGGQYPPVRDGAKQSAWGSTLASTTVKTIASVTSDSVTFSSPLFLAIPKPSLLTADKATLAALDDSGDVHEVGVAHLNVVGRYIAGTVSDTVQLTLAVLDNVQDAWLDDIVATDFGISYANIGAGGRRITVQDLLMQRSEGQSGGAKPFDISLKGTETLVQAARSTSGHTFYLATQSNTHGPNVGYNLRFAGGGTIEPHQRWATGLLIDNAAVPQGGIAYVDRGIMGSGHGWGIGFGVVYNSVAGTEPLVGSAGMDMPPGFTINQPPMGVNWGLGLVGPLSKKHVKSPRVVATALPMPSLFAQQRFDRYGADGLATLLGPYRITDRDRRTCLTAARAAAKEGVTMQACAPDMLWDVTSWGGLRAAGTTLCVDLGDMKTGTSPVLMPCADGPSQAFFVPQRDGTPQALMQKHVGHAQPLCIVPAATPRIEPCDDNGQDVRLELSTLAFAKR